MKEIVKSEINKKIIAKANFTDVDISLLRSFPKLNTRVLDLEINGVGDFEGKNLLKVKELSLDIDILSVLLTSRPVEIVNFSLVEPFVNILINPDGKTNYNIFKETDEKDKSSESKLINLKKYSIENGQIVYTDHQNLNKITLKDINHTGKGNFKTRNFVLKTNTDISKMSYFSAGVPLAKDLHLISDLAMEVDLDKMQFKLAENNLKINDLSIVSEGVIKVNEKDIELDMKVKAPGNNFRELFSVVPNAYISDFKDVKTEGSFSFAGFIKGKYGLETDEIPDFDFNIKANNGYVKYPKLELPVEKINADIRIYKTGDMISNTNVNIMPLTFSVDGESFLVKMHVSDLTTDPLTNGEIRGTLNLEALSKAFPMKDIKRLTGKIYSDVVFNVNQSLSNKKNIKGKARLDKVFVSYSSMPAISVSSLNADFNNDIINCTGISAKAGKSDFTGTLKVLNPLNYNVKGKTVIIDIDSKSNFVDADEWTETGEETEETDNTGMIDLLINKLKLKFRLGIQDLNLKIMTLKES